MSGASACFCLTAEAEHTTEPITVISAALSVCTCGSISRSHCLEYMGRKHRDQQALGPGSRGEWRLGWGPTVRVHGTELISAVQGSCPEPEMLLLGGSLGG